MQATRQKDVPKRTFGTMRMGPGRFAVDASLKLIVLYADIHIKVTYFLEKKQVNMMEKVQLKHSKNILRDSCLLVQLNEMSSI